MAKKIGIHYKDSRLSEIYVKLMLLLLKFETMGKQLLLRKELEKDMLYLP